MRGGRTDEGTGLIRNRAVLGRDFGNRTGYGNFPLISFLPAWSLEL